MVSFNLQVKFDFMSYIQYVILGPDEKDINEFFLS